MGLKSKYLKMSGYVDNNAILYFLVGSREYEKVKLIIEKCSSTEVLITSPNYPFEVWVNGEGKSLNGKIHYQIKKFYNNLDFNLIS
jgi:hypothetical protein